METNSTAVEWIDPAEFMARMGIKRSTFYEWVASGRLVRQKHYVKAGRITRIRWNTDLVFELDDNWQKEPISNPEKKLKRNITGVGTGKRVKINLDL